MSEFLEWHANTPNKYNCFEKNANQTNGNEKSNELSVLRHFKDMINANVNLVLKDKTCCTDDNFLNRFLYARKFKLEEAMQLLINYLSFKNRNHLLLEKINIFDEHIQSALRDGNPGVLKQRDRKGRKVISFTASNWETSKYTLQDVYRSFLLSLDKLLENIQNQALGFIVIVDWTNFTFKQSTHLSPRILKLMIEGLQDCMPANFKGIHFISQPWYVDVALAVIKPFLNDKTKKRIFIHGTNLATLHDLISKDILPPDLGGEGPVINNLNWYHYLLESSQMSEPSRSYRLIEATVYSRTLLSSDVIHNGTTKNNNTKSESTIKS